jgi:hypothetical protein
LWPRFSAGGPTVCAGCGAEDCLPGCDVCTQSTVVWRCMMKEADTLAETLAQDLDGGLAPCNGLRGGARGSACPRTVHQPPRCEPRLLAQLRMLVRLPVCLVWLLVQQPVWRLRPKTRNPRLVSCWG